MKSWTFRLMCVLWLSVGASISSAHADPIIVGFYNFAPLISLDRHGKAQGPLYRFSEKLFAHAGLHAEYRELPSARLYDALKKGHVHLWLGTRKAELAPYVLEGQRVLGQLQLNLYYLKGTPRPQSPEDVTGKRLIVLNGYNYWPSIYHSLLSPYSPIATLSTTTHSAALSLLARGRGDYLLNYQAPTQLHARHQRLNLEHIPIEQLPMRFIISKQAPNASGLREALDNAYDKMLYSGQQVNLSAQ